MKRILYRITAFFLSIMTFLAGLPMSTFAVTYTRQGNYIITDDGTIYYENDVGGLKAYVPFNIARDGDDMRTLTKLLKLPGMQGGSGSMANQAAFRYNGFSAYAGGASQYLVKTAASMRRPMQGDLWKMPPYYRYNSSELLSFRYVGMVMNKEGAVIAGTNPEFPTDFVRLTPFDQAGARAALQYTKFIDPVTKMRKYEAQPVTVYGYDSAVYNLHTMRTNGYGGTDYYPGNGNIRSNRATAINGEPKLAKKAFDRWFASDDGFGEAYRQKAINYQQGPGAAKYGKMEPWEVLNHFFQITGDPEDENSTLYFYVVNNENGPVYTTYSTRGKIIKNTSPTLFAIKDNKTGSIMTESYRTASEMDGANGLGPEVIGPEVKLQYDKHYTLEGILSYYSLNGEASKTNRSANLSILAETTDPTAVPIDVHINPTSSLPSGGALSHASATDGKSYGPISPGGLKTEAGEDGTSYYYNGAAFFNTMFSLPDTAPNSGYIILSVPDAFGENGDNDCQNDDRIAIRYVIEVEETPQPVIQEQHSYGDLNLGRPEYRSLHYTQLEEPEEEEDDDDDDGGGGEEEEDPEPTPMEKISDYGAYASANSTPIDHEEENDTPKTPNQIDIWRTDPLNESNLIGDPWWEYIERRWPDQNEDLDYKCWLLTASGAWNRSNEFLRSKYGENQFGFAFRVSRSRGEIGTVVSSAKLETQIYGVSPDTGEDGVLLRDYTDEGKDFKLLSTGALGPYESSDTQITGVVSSAAINGIEDFPRLRVVSKLSKELHGESGMFSSLFEEPAENSWEEEHDTVDRTFACEMDDMRIMEIEVKDSEGIVVYHADRYDSDQMDVVVDGYYDREEDLFMKIVIEQHVEKGHAVNEPAIDVSIRGVSEEGMEESTYIDTTYTKENMKMGLGVRMEYTDIAFRPRAAEKLQFSIQINEKHGEDMWRENIWDNDEDSYSFTLAGTTADLALSQDIELYNSKNNLQNFVTFAEYLNFKYNIKHIGSSERQTAIVGGSGINPYAKVNVKIFNADALTLNPQNGNLVYRMATQDPKAAAAFLKGGDIAAKTRLFPGLGTNGFSSHVQAWYKYYVAQSYRTDTRNIAAHGHILAPGNTSLSNPLHAGRKASQTTDLYSRLTVGDFIWLGSVRVSTEIWGLVYAVSDGDTGTAEEMKQIDRIALAYLGIVLD